jgi:hypothetical protein
MSDEQYPEHPPLFPAQLKGVATVKGSDQGTFYTVNFDTGECDCQHGAAWRWNNRRYVANSFCNHKLKAIASLLAKEHDDKLYDFYEVELGRRYNPFVAVSAMHKEIRRGDVEQALYWATAMIPHRGNHGVINYLRNIVFEETRDLPLARYIMKLSAYGKSVSRLDAQRAVERFCVAPKKWELPWRHDIFIDEMRGYKKLASDYGYDVAKPKDIIPTTAYNRLQQELLSGFAKGDRVSVQVGLKGLFKSKSEEHEHHKIDILNELVAVMNEEHDNAFDYDHDYARELYDLIQKRYRNHAAIGYHELNALADALTGERAAAATVPIPLHKRVINKPKMRRIPLKAGLRRVPMYAHDNHTWDGKAKMRSYGAVELRPGAEQTHIDFRLCGAYMGVAWRTLAYKQHETIEVKWGDVKWKPNWLWQHLDNMWY